MNILIDCMNKERDFILANNKRPKFLIVSIDIRNEILAQNIGYPSLGDEVHEMFAGLILSVVAPGIKNFMEVA